MRIRWVVPLAALLALPALHTGLVIDDSSLRARLWTPAGIRWRGLLDAFSFVRGDFAQLRELGDVPWWSDPALQLSFFRPLTALTHALDFALLPPWWMHVESMLWLAALNVAVASWYRRFLEPEPAALASLFFAVAPGHVFAASWLANRNAVLAALFAVWSLSLYARKGSTWPAAGVLGLSLLSGEIGLGAVALWLAYAVCLDRSVKRLAPGLLVTVVWLGLRADYGVYASSLYVDPLREPLRFALAYVANMPWLVFGQLGVPAIALAALVARPIPLVALTLMPWLPRARALLRDDARARFGLLGALLALTPVAATVPHDRLLIVADIAGLGFLAQVLSWRYDGWAKAWAAARIGLSVLIALGYAASMELQGQQERSLDVVTDAAPVFLNSPGSYYPIQLRRRRMHFGGVVPTRVRVLASGLYPTELERRDPHTLRIGARGGLLQPAGRYRAPGPQPPWFSPVYLVQKLDLFSRASWHVRPGDALRLSDVTLRVVRATADGFPEQVDFHFDAALDTISFWAWQSGRYVRFVLPPQGLRAQLAGTHAL